MDRLDNSTGKFVAMDNDSNTCVLRLLLHGVVDPKYHCRQTEADERTKSMGDRTWIGYVAQSKMDAVSHTPEVTSIPNAIHQKNKRKRKNQDECDAKNAEKAAQKRQSLILYLSFDFGRKFACSSTQDKIVHRHKSGVVRRHRQVDQYF